MQESAQYLAGKALPELLLRGVLSGPNSPRSGKLLVVNLTPYDGHLEKTCLDWGKNSESSLKIKSLSLTTRGPTSDFCSRSMAIDLLKD